MPVKILVSYYDRIAGPWILNAVPSNINDSDKNIVIKLFDLNLDAPFFEVKHEEALYLNYKFNIPSGIARTGYELLLISVILTEEHTIFNWRKELQSLSEQIKNIPHILEIFSHKNKTSPIIQMKISKIDRFLRQAINKFEEFEGDHPYGQLLFLGIEAVGKTSIIELLRYGTFSPKIRPTLGTQILRAAIEHFQFQIYDVGGQKAIRQTWFKDCHKPDAIIYVVDVSSSETRDFEFKEEFERVIQQYFPTPASFESNHIPILILLNKSDLVEKEKSESLIKKFSQLFNVNQLPMPHSMSLVSVKENIGVLSAFQWLISKKLME
ncbi:ADP-ribosylation factor-like protein [Candidatus Lokiarchaeum ossiferum]|uniref:ADP-ribosylation factor-like protein n=1 Tax=Candidatus Lokiarchaeum ossiferum TaxID=2951803 RepID=UPI00352C194D